MSYDLSLYLKTAPTLTPEAFAETCKLFGLTVECCPDFTMDGSLYPLCAKFSGAFADDSRDYLAAVEYNRSKTEETISFALPGPQKKWWQFRKPKGETVEIPVGSEDLFFSCGIDSLEVPFALLLACALAGEDGLLFDPQSGDFFIGQSAIAAEVTRALDELKSTPADRLYLHEFTEWI